MGDEASDTDPPRCLIETLRSAVVLHVEELIGRYQEGVERLPVQQVAGDLRNRIRRRLIEPGHHLATRVDEGRFGVSLVVGNERSLLLAREGVAGPASRTTVSPAKAAPPFFKSCVAKRLHGSCGTPLHRSYSETRLLARAVNDGCYSRACAERAGLHQATQPSNRPVSFLSGFSPVGRARRESSPRSTSRRLAHRRSQLCRGWCRTPRVPVHRCAIPPGPTPSNWAAPVTLFAPPRMSAVNEWSPARIS